MKFSMKDFFSKCDQIRRKLRIWSHLLKKSLIENFIFCAVKCLFFKCNLQDATEFSEVYIGRIYQITSYMKFRVFQLISHSMGKCSKTHP